MDILVATYNPSDYISWSKDQQLERLRLIMERHDRDEALDRDRLPFAWGTHQILSQVNPSPVVHALVTVYRVEDVAEFDELMGSDPLRHRSRYTTILLDKLDSDYEVDLQRFDETMEMVRRSNNAAQNKELDRIRARFSAAPEFVGSNPFRAPEMPFRGYVQTEREKKLEFLVYGVNLPQDPAWDDMTKAIHYEKVLWWHQYVSKMISDRRISHAWGTLDFCDIEGLSVRSAGGAVIYQANDFTDFADVYKQDPLRTRAQFWSVALKPLSAQREQDEKTLERYGK